MTQTVLTAIFSSIFAGLITSLVAAIVSSRLKDHFDRKLENLKKQIKNEEMINQSRWEIKRQACLKSLNLVNAYFANLEWVEKGKILDIDKQEKPKIETIRDCCNELALSCDEDKVIKSFLKCLRLYDVPISGDYINELRNEVRKELGFGKPFELNKERSWIGKLQY